MITKRSEPVARAVPIEVYSPAPLFGHLKGTVSFHRDVVAPDAEAWSALSGDEDDLFAALGPASP